MYLCHKCSNEFGVPGTYMIDLVHGQKRKPVAGEYEFRNTRQAKEFVRLCLTRRDVTFIIWHRATVQVNESAKVQRLYSKLIATEGRD